MGQKPHLLPAVAFLVTGGAALPTENLRPLTTLNFSSIQEMAERQEFEPWAEVSPYDGLANRCLQPLGHLSVITIDVLL